MGNNKGAALPEQRRWIANFFRGKVEEFAFHLETIVNACDISLFCFRERQEQRSEIHKAVIYGFSGFGNVVQTLKDSSSTLLDMEVTWGEIARCTHGSFIKSCRNAATHDGNPVITAWADGYFYVPAKIRRLDQHNKLVTIDPPTADIRTVCLQFALGYSEMLIQRLSPLVGDPLFAGTAIRMEELTEFLESAHAPDFAKELFRANQSDIVRSIQESTFDPVADAITKLETVSEYCERKLQFNAA